MESSKKDAELQTLLDLNGIVFWPKPGYWVKFSVKTVEPSKHIPHGIIYSLTLHDRYNRRILGFDNAHAFKKKARSRKKYAGRIVRWDHIHKLDEMMTYEFDSASQLLSDFWNAVDEFISIK